MKIHPQTRPYKIRNSLFIANMAQNSSKKIFISTGEVSGDLQGSLLIAALHRQAANLDWELEIVALGGQRMAKA
jgi:lipid-A-disaccharide synthase